MELSQKTFEVLDTLDRQPINNQRQLAQHAGISLGQVNYILKSLLGKGLVKAGNFRKSRRKIGYAYLLTPKGIQTKSRLAVRFITSKLEEYDTLRNRLAERLAAVEGSGHRHLAFVGPQIVKDFIGSIIVEKKFDLVLTGYFRDYRELRAIETDSYDVVLLFDNVSGGLSKIAEATAMPKHKLFQLW
jgi:MarR family transcriptional regulator, temperature-dependent positive regulator of motility